MEYFAYSQKAFVYKYVVMPCDTDQFKHMSFANYLKLMFLAADALLVSCLSPESLSHHRLKSLNSRLQFKRQTTIGENILIKVNVSEIDGSRFSHTYTRWLADWQVGKYHRLVPPQDSEFSIA